MHINSIYILSQTISVIVAITLSVLNHFFYELSGESFGVAWFAAVDESVIQHLKMLLFPWVVLIVPLDVCWAALSKNLARHGILFPREKKKIIKRPTIEVVLSANLASIILSLWAISIIFAIFYYAMGENVIVSIVIFIVCSVLGLVPARLSLINNPRISRWLIITSVFVSILAFFVYTSYVRGEDLLTGYWLDPHKTVPTTET